MRSIGSKPQEWLSSVQIVSLFLVRTCVPSRLIHINNQRRIMIQSMRLRANRKSVLGPYVRTKPVDPHQQPEEDYDPVNESNRFNVVSLIILDALTRR